MNFQGFNSDHKKSLVLIIQVKPQDMEHNLFDNLIFPESMKTLILFLFINSPGNKIIQQMHMRLHNSHHFLLKPWKKIYLNISPYCDKLFNHLIMASWCFFPVFVNPGSHDGLCYFAPTKTELNRRVFQEA